jgi:hypothetical protein
MNAINFPMRESLAVMIDVHSYLSSLVFALSIKYSDTFTTLHLLLVTLRTGAKYFDCTITKYSTNKHRIKNINKKQFKGQKYVMSNK